jgi:hypothetical protein
MNRPGSRLRAFAAGWCCPETMERVIDPLIADVQREHADAVRHGRVWRSRRIQIAGWLTFFKVLVVCAGTHLATIERWTTDDRKSLVRAAVISAITALVITVLLVSRSAEDLPTVLLHPSPKRLLYLAPYPFVAGIVLGGTLGIVLGLGGRALSRRLVAAAIGVALICSAIVFIDVGWVAPAANIAYRMTVFGDADPTPGMGEQSLIALRRKIEQVRRESEDAPSGFLAGLSFEYDRRVALSFSPLVFTLFAIAMAGCLRRRWLLGIAACAAFLVYGWLIIVVKPWNLQPWDLRAPPYAAAWLPNAVIGLLAAVFGLLSVRRWRAQGAPPA